MHCSKCGVENSDGSTHCVGCGSPLMAAAEQQPVAVQGQPVAAAAEPKTSGLAIAAFVMGLLSITCVLWPLLVVPAIICAIIAIVKIGKSNGQLKGKGLAVTGLVIPSVMTLLMPVIAMVLAIMMPALSKAREQATKVVCLNNMRGLSVAMMIYANDYDDTLPTENWCDLLIEQADVSPKSFVCVDSDAIEGESSYAMNKHLAGKKLGDVPANVVLYFETDMGLETGPRDTSIKTRRFFEYYRVYDEDTLVYKDRFNQFGGPEDLTIRHDRGRSGCNIAYADGHTAFENEEGIANLRWTAD